MTNFPKFHSNKITSFITTEKVTPLNLVRRRFQQAEELQSRAAQKNERESIAGVSTANPNPSHHQMPHSSSILRDLLLRFDTPQSLSLFNFSFLTNQFLSDSGSGYRTKSQNASPELLTLHRKAPPSPSKHSWNPSFFRRRPIPPPPPPSTLPSRTSPLRAHSYPLLPPSSPSRPTNPRSSRGSPRASRHSPLPPSSTSPKRTPPPSRAGAPTRLPSWG